MPTGLAAREHGNFTMDGVIVSSEPLHVAAARSARMRCLAVLTTHNRNELSGATHITTTLGATSLDTF